MNTKLLQPSGLNNRFYGEGLAFQDYCALMQTIISESRFDLNSTNANIIVNANSPFIFEPQKSSDSKSQNGILFIHGLFDSPYFLSDVAKYFSAKGFITYSVLLPGHGTRPGDLLQIDYREWIKAVNYGIRCLATKVKNLYLTGFSLGGSLALHQAIQHQECKGLMLFAPALKTRSFLRYFIVKNHKLFSWTGEKNKWYYIAPQTNFAKYNSYAFNAGYQAILLMNETTSLLKHRGLQCPVFTVASRDDETVSSKAILDFFCQTTNAQSRLLYYTTQEDNFIDDRIKVRTSCFPDKNILDFSHICLPISPLNPFFGEQSDFEDLNHYVKHQNMEKPIYAGAVTNKNLNNYVMKRLTYNPDFDIMISLMEEFLSKITPDDSPST